ncbi:DEAD/DEAH box helicase [Massilibacteroides vaginae]|uniref:DEAD/DEAH box helicase n=1 Tax=Massilibacteroides vaginae TaxID=1673718 RepID=UPI000A1C8BB9|nr:DEAD/DEAH box helicase [Massilibacteroides vaginae]
MKLSRFLVVTINNHPVFGPLLIPYFACETSPGVLQTEDNATIKQKKEITLSREEKKIISLAQFYTERNLMKVYSKEHTISDFVNKLKPKTFKESIRPHIEKIHLQIIPLIRKASVPVYLRDTGADLLYEHHLIHLPKENTEAVFSCESTEQHFRYALGCYQNGKLVTLQRVKPYLVLASDPAVLVIGKDMLVFDRLRSRSVSPFLEKTYVEAPASETNRYLDKVVLPLMTDHPIKTKGINIIERQPQKTAELLPLTSLTDTPELKLTFKYDQTEFNPGQKANLTYPRLENTQEATISYFRRDPEWEKQHIDFLLAKGFHQISDSLFQNKSFISEYALVDWMNQEKEEIFRLFSCKIPEDQSTYFIGDIELKQDMGDQTDWFEVRIRVQIGAYTFPFIAFKKNIMTGDRRFPLPDGRIALLPEEWFDKYSSLFAFGEEQNDQIVVKKMHHSIINDLNEKVLKVAEMDYSEKEIIPVPPKIKVTLRPYQQTGFSWLVHLAKNRLGGCLADDMGLGKTLQTITLLQHLYDPDPFLPQKEKTSLVADQEGQLALFDEVNSDCESIVTEEPIHASLIVVPTSLVTNWKREIRKFSSLRVYEYSGERRTPNANRAFKRHHIVLVTYGLLRRDIDLLEEYAFNYVILDESQYIKNPESQTYHSVMRLKSEHRLALTGTPIENSLKDLWAQFNFINPGLLGTASFFRNHFTVPIMKTGDTRIQDKLLRLISPFILRRTKQQVAPELPPLTEKVIYCEMTPEQKDIYKKEKNSLRNSLLNEWSKNKIMALNGIMRLRQLANHPSLVLPDYKGTSGKMEQITEAYETLLSEGHKVLIFSSFVTHLELLAKEFDQRGWKYALLTGATIDREKEINRFTQTKSVSAFLISLKAGGVGLNLTEADYVFILDPWWNPAAETQAESRAHRIGQGKQVFVYRFISDHTIEEKIRSLQERKSTLAETFIAENDPLQSLTDHEWKDLIRG